MTKTPQSFDGAMVGLGCELALTTESWYSAGVGVVYESADLGRPWADPASTASLSSVGRYVLLRLVVPTSMLKCDQKGRKLIHKWISTRSMGTSARRCERTPVRGRIARLAWKRGIPRRVGDPGSAAAKPSANPYDADARRARLVNGGVGTSAYDDMGI